MGRYYAAVDIGATKTTVSVSCRSGILARVYQLTRKVGDRGTVPRQIDFLIGYTCEQAQIDRSQIAAVGISTALSLVMPENWIADWKKRKPWQQAPDTTVLEPDIA